jgi:hypothetical protein
LPSRDVVAELRPTESDLSWRAYRLMTEKQAWAEAHRRFGSLGAVYCFHGTFFEVGVRTSFNFMLAYGMGACWETAFADAAKRLEGD